MVRELPDIPVRLADVPPVPGVEHRDVAVNGVRLHVAEVGAGAPLILLHGWPQRWWCWRRLMLRLAEDYRVLALDLRGWGWSDAPRDDYAKDTFATDIVALMDAERLDRVSLLGHDWGGYTSFLLSLEHPERIARMIALDVTPPQSARREDRWRWALPPGGGA
jgi:pimeloyl-ACP methyl ester carboxylesterase